MLKELHLRLQRLSSTRSRSSKRKQSARERLAQAHQYRAAEPPQIDTPTAMRKKRNTKSIVAYYARGFSLRGISRFGLSMQRIHQLLVRDKKKIIRPPYDTREHGNQR